MSAIWSWVGVPGAWVTPFILAGAVIALFGLSLIESVRSLTAGFRRQQSTWTISTRILVGHLVSLPVAVVTIVLARFADAPLELLFYASALLSYLAIAWVIPRRPLVQEQQERKHIRLLLPSFISYLRASLSGYEPRQTTLLRYATRQDTRLAPMQRVVMDALDLMQAGMLPFAALEKVARDRGVRELVDVAILLRQSELKGTDPLPVLTDIQATLDQILYDAFREMIERRKLWLLLVSAMAVVGVLVQILFVVVVGSGALSRFF